MADYLKALNAGIGAAQQAKKNLASIQLVLTEASDQLSEASGKHLRLERKTAVRPLTPSSVSESRLGRASTVHIGLALMAPREMVPYTALALSVDSAKEDWVELCEWIPHQDGYPVRLKFSGKEVACHDKRSLEAGLVSVLSDSKIGADVEALLSRTNTELMDPLARRDTGMDDEL